MKSHGHLEPHHYPDYIILFLPLSRSATFHGIISPIQLQGARTCLSFPRHALPIPAQNTRPEFTFGVEGELPAVVAKDCVAFCLSSSLFHCRLLLGLVTSIKLTHLVVIVSPPHRVSQLESNVPTSSLQQPRLYLISTLPRNPFYREPTTELHALLFTSLPVSPSQPWI